MNAPTPPKTDPLILATPNLAAKAKGAGSADADPKTTPRKRKPAAAGGRGTAETADKPARVKRQAKAGNAQARREARVAAKAKAKAKTKTQTGGKGGGPADTQTKAKPKAKTPATGTTGGQAKPTAKPTAKPATGTALAVTQPSKPPAKPAPAKPPATSTAKPPAKPASPAKPAIPVAQPVSESSFQSRHLIVLLSFLLVVMVIPAMVAWYLWTRAADQYASTVAFSVRTEEGGSSIASLLGPLNLSSSSTSDTDILYEFVQSQELVARVDEKLDLRTVWSKADPDIDPYFSFHPPGTIEDLLGHWGRMVKVFYDSGTGLLELRVLAFEPEDAKAIAEEIYAESTAMVNELSQIAREDAIRYARDDLNQAVERLKEAREAVTKFRNRTQIVDPTVDLQGQAGLLNILNQQLVDALIEADLLSQTTRSNDPRIAQAERRVQVIETRIEEEKRKLGSVGDDAFATLLGEYERLAVDREFAEQTYTAALAGFDAAQAEARRQSRYLAAHVRPTLAQKSEYPERLSLLGLVTLFLFLIWAIVVLISYSLRDRR